MKSRDQTSVLLPVSEFAVRSSFLVDFFFSTFLDGILQMRADEIPSEKLERGSKKVKTYMYYYDK